MQLKSRIKDILEVRDNSEATSVLEARKHIFQVQPTPNICQA